MAALCYLEPDLSLIRLFTEQENEQLTLARTSNESETDANEQDPVVALRRRAADAAAWIIDRLGGRPRLDLVCVGVNQAVCTWVTAPSPEPTVIAAAVNQKGQDWSNAGIGASAVQALISPQRPGGRGLDRLPIVGSRSAASRASPHMTVLNLRDGPLRLWLDEMDRRGGRIQLVTTLWHAAAIAWSAPDPHRAETNGQQSPSPNGEQTQSNAEAEPTGVVLAEPGGGLVWIWGRDGELLAGGVVDAPAASETGPRPQDEAEIDARCGRLALDWLGWTAHLESAPSRVAVVGVQADRLAERLDRLWPQCRLTVVEEADPLGATLRRVGAHTSPPGIDADPRRSLVDLTRRPSGAHRRLGVWASVAVMILAAAVTGMGWRAQRLRSEYLTQQQRLAEQVRDRVAEVAPGLANHPSPVLALQSHKQTVLEQNPPIQQPPAPRPILDELTRLASALSETLSEQEDAYATRIEIDEITANAQVQVPDYATGELLLERLRQSVGLISWQGTFVGTPPARQRLTGTWEQSS